MIICVRRSIPFLGTGSSHNPVELSDDDNDDDDDFKPKSNIRTSAQVGIFKRSNILRTGHFVLFIPRHTKSGGVLCYTLRTVWALLFCALTLVFFTDFLQTLHRHWYRGVVIWDCKWASFSDCSFKRIYTDNDPDQTTPKSSLTRVHTVWLSVGIFFDALLYPW